MATCQSSANQVLVERRFFESQRDSATKPRVARNELPWVRREQDNNPNGVATRCCARSQKPKPRWGFAFLSRCPRVARSSQRWALGRNPFGIGKLSESDLRSTIYLAVLPSLTLSCPALSFACDVQTCFIIRARGRSTPSDRQADGRSSVRRKTSDAAGCHRLGQDVYRRECHSKCESADAGDLAQQDAGRATLRRIQKLFPAQRSRVLCQLFRLLSARGLHPAHGHVHREGFQHQRRDRTLASFDHELALRPA